MIVGVAFLSEECPNLKYVNTIQMRKNVDEIAMMKVEELCQSQTFLKNICSRL